MDRIIGFDTQLFVQMFIQFLNTSVCIYILYRFLYKPVKKFMQARTKKISKEIELAEKKLSEAEKLKEEYTQRLKQIEDKQNEMLEAAHKQAIVNKNLIIYEAQQEALKIKTHAKLEIEYEKQQLQSDIKNQIVNVSWVIINDFLKKNLDRDTQNKLVQAAVEKIGEMKW